MALNVDIAIRIVRERCTIDDARRYAVGVLEAKHIYGKRGRVRQMNYLLESIHGWRDQEAQDIRNSIRRYIEFKQEIQHCMR